jgi:hypothetical protein
MHFFRDVGRRAATACPYPFSGYRMSPGITACAADLSDQDRAR